jgi:hypothetical protein
MSTDTGRVAQKRLSFAPQPGERYRHYKGGHYEIVCSSIKEDTLEVIVTYRSLESGFLWSRSLLDWSAVVHDRQTRQRVPRFQRTEASPCPSSPA